jgi:hypothetical protein
VSRLLGILAVIRFQMWRSLTAMRWLWWFVLVIFPPAVVALTFVAARDEDVREEMLRQIQIQEIYVLVPNVLCMLGVFLWTSTVLQSEIENRSWIYVAVRPDARWAHIIGSYIVAVLWTISAALVSLAICVAEIGVPREERFQIVSTLTLLVVISSFAYASIYLLIGVLFFRRAMIVAVVYTLGIEFLLGALPTTISQLTLQYRLRSIWFIRMGWLDGRPPGMDIPIQLFGKPPISLHVAGLAIVTCLCIIASGWLVSRREIPIQEESAFQ